MPFYIHGDFALSYEATIASDAALGLWVTAGSWVARRRTGGIVPVRAIKSLLAPSGPDTADNLRPAHAHCNVSRGTRDPEQFRRELIWRSK